MNIDIPLKGIVALRPYLGLTFQSTGIARGQAQTLFETILNCGKFSKDSNGIFISGYQGLSFMPQGFFSG